MKCDRTTIRSWKCLRNLEVRNGSVIICCTRSVWYIVCHFIFKRLSFHSKLEGFFSCRQDEFLESLHLKTFLLNEFNLVTNLSRKFSISPSNSLYFKKHSDPCKPPPPPHNFQDSGVTLLTFADLRVLP